MGEVRQMVPPFMVDGVNSAEVFLSNMDYAQVSAAVITQEFICLLYTSFQLNSGFDTAKSNNGIFAIYLQYFAHRALTLYLYHSSRSNACQALSFLFGFLGSQLLG